MNVRKHKMAVKKLFKQSELKGKYYYDDQCGSVYEFDEDDNAYRHFAKAGSWTEARLEILYNEFDPTNVDFEVENIVRKYA